MIAYTIAILTIGITIGASGTIGLLELARYARPAPPRSFRVDRRT